MLQWVGEEREGEARCGRVIKEYNHVMVGRRDDLLPTNPLYMLICCFLQPLHALHIAGVSTMIYHSLIVHDNFQFHRIRACQSKALAEFLTGSPCFCITLGLWGFGLGWEFTQMKEILFKVCMHLSWNVVFFIILLVHNSWKDRIILTNGKLKHSKGNNYSRYYLPLKIEQIWISTGN